MTLHLTHERTSERLWNFADNFFSFSTKEENAFYHRQFSLNWQGSKRMEARKTATKNRLNHSTTFFVFFFRGAFNLFSFPNNWHSQNTSSIHSSCRCWCCCQPSIFDCFDEMPKWISIIFCSFGRCRFLLHIFMPLRDSYVSYIPQMSLVNSRAYLNKNRIIGCEIYC